MHENIEDCIICMDNKKEIVFMTSEHFYTCNNSSKITKRNIGKTCICRKIKKI